MVTYVFPGQGSQHKGMGGELFDEFRELLQRADDILGFSVKELCLEDPKMQLNKTQYTQPALFIVNALTYLKKVRETGTLPDYVAGHSLGEYNALFAAGAFDFETGLQLVKKRGELMGQAAGGAMAAVLGLNEEKIAEILGNNNLTAVDIANENSPSQIVLSGARDDIGQAAAVFEKAGARYIPLKVSGAFHSRYMEPSKKEYSEFLRSFEFKKLSVPVISNVHARPYKEGETAVNLADQITHRVKWTESIRYLLGKGEMEFQELGPGKVLIKLIQTIRKEAAPLIVADDDQNTGPLPGAAEGNGRKSGQRAASGITAASLGNEDFKKEYNLKYAYVTGAMYRGIASAELVIRMGRAGMMGFFGTGGLEIQQIEKVIQVIQKELNKGEAYGMNLLFNPFDPRKEEDTVDLFLRYGVRTIEAAAYMTIVPSLVRYRLQGVKRNAQGMVSVPNRIIAKVSRPEVAGAFLGPAPERILRTLLAENKITQAEADLSKEIPMADDICVEADSGGHTDGGVAYALVPAIIRLRDDMMKKFGYARTVRVGAAGGIGTPEAGAAAFILGADFILTGSINQCTVEAGTSDAVKDLLQQINVQDTEYAPAGDMFELGAKIQVLKKGVFFPARANKLYDLYRQCNSLDELDEKTRKQIQEKYFRRTFEEIYEDVRKYYPPQEIERAERNPKQKMALVFRWYFGHSSRLALSGAAGCEVDYQVHCGPALGAFNQWVKGTNLENWRNRHVDEIAVKVMDGTAEVLTRRLQAMLP